LEQFTELIAVNYSIWGLAQIMYGAVGSGCVHILYALC